MSSLSPRVSSHKLKTTMTKETSADSGLQGQAAVADTNIIQQNMSMHAIRPKAASETDALMMDDVQFRASLDRLLDCEFVDSAYNSASTPRTVSNDPSVASSASSIAATRAPQQVAAAQLPSSASAFSVARGSLPPPAPQQPRAPPAAAATRANTLLPPPLKNPLMTTGPSPLTQRLAFAMPMSAGPASVRSASISGMTEASSGKRLAGTKRSSLAVSEDEGDREKRRQDRNLREQQRSRRITEQINLLRDVLVEAGVPCKPDKNSTLIGVHDYITQLQSRASFLDEEHKKLLDTIARTNEMVNNAYYQATADGSSVASGATPAPVSNDLLSDANVANCSLEDEDAVFVQGLDYRSVFKRCGIALAVASIDGRFIDCNSEFVTLSGYSRKELLPGEELSKTELRAEDVPSMAGEAADPPTRNLSLFNLLNREDMETVFTAMSGMLRRPMVRRPDASVVSDDSAQQDYWSGFVRQNRENDSTTVSRCIAFFH